MTTKSVDDLLVAVENSKMGVSIPESPQETPVDPPKEEVAQETNEDVLHGTDEHEQDDTPVENEEVDNHSDKVDKEDSEPKAEKAENIDEYGNPIKKQRTYTEDEVQRMIRERLARGRHVDQQPQQPHPEQQPSEAINEDEPWDVQLKKFVKQTMQETHQEETKRQWQQQEIAKQAEFESKFTTGMEKYDDFRETISDKPITDTMLLSIRNLKDPAAFIYGAAKLHGKELDRIARIPDQLEQASEMGRLHEKMVKNARRITKAPAPIDTPKGSLPNKALNQPSLEERIHSYAKQKRK